MTATDKRSFKTTTAYELRFSPRGHQVCSLGRNVALWDVERRRRIASAHPLSHPSHVDFSPDGSRVAVKATSGATVTLEVPSLDVESRIADEGWGEGSPIRFASNTYLVDGSWAGALVVRNCSTGAIEHSDRYSGAMVTELTSSSDRSLFAYVIAKKGVEGWGPNDSIVVRRWPFDRNNETVIARVPKIWGFALSPDATKLATIQQSGPLEYALQLFDVKTGASVGVNTIAPRANSVAWSADAALLAYTAGDKIFALDAVSLEPISEIDLVYACFVEFSPDGSRAAGGSWEKGTVFPVQRFATEGSA